MNCLRLFWLILGEIYSMGRCCIYFICPFSKLHTQILIQNSRRQLTGAPSVKFWGASCIYMRIDSYLVTCHNIVNYHIRKSVSVAKSNVASATLLEAFFIPMLALPKNIALELIRILSLFSLDSLPVRCRADNIILERRIYDIYNLECSDGEGCFERF